MVLHIIVRGNRRQNIFEEEADWRRFQEALLEAARTEDFELLGFCLMGDHAHILIRCGEKPIGQIFRPVLSSHALYLNKKYGCSGHLFQGRYTAIQCRSDEGAKHLLRYIHRNPVRSRLVATAAEWPWSSHRAYCGEEMPGVKTDFILNLFSSDRTKAIALYRAFMEDVAVPPQAGEKGDLNPLAAHMERAGGFDPGILSGPRRNAPASRLRKEFIQAAVRGGHSIAEIAVYLNRSETAVYALLGGKRGVS